MIVWWSCAPKNVENYASESRGKMVEQIKKAVEDADLVLVGIGEDFGISEKQIMNERPEVFADETLGEQALGYLVCQCRLQEAGDAARYSAYKNLWNLICDKNYFCISVNTDDILYQPITESGETFRQNRIVTPCGGYRKLQCSNGCEGVWEKPQDAWKIWAKEYVQMFQPKGTDRMVPAMPAEQVCPKCGKPLVFNNVYAQQYNEQGYLSEWEIYTKWLEGTVNRKVCILELGAGMKFPTVIRWPFEKVTAYNRKATMFRIHKSLYQFPDRVEGRGIGVKEDPVDFFANKFV